MKCVTSNECLEKLKSVTNDRSKKEKLLKWFVDSIQGESDFNVYLKGGEPWLVLETTWSSPESPDRIEYALKPHEVEQILQL